MNQWEIGQRVRVDFGFGDSAVGTISRIYKGDQKIDLDNGGHCWHGTRQMELIVTDNR